jgi:parallel beta-helix repeat protein
MGLVGVLGMSVFSLAEVQVDCDDFPLHLNGETAKLTSDCSNSLTVYGPGTLDLDGHTVNGPGSSGTGISVQGRGAEIVNGTVKRWNTAVFVQGEGNHKIVNLKIENNRRGIRVDDNSNENSVINNFVKDNSDRGIRVQKSYSNKLINNYVDNSIKGICIDDNSANNTIVNNTLVANSQENCDIKGNNNLVVHNIAENGADECFVIGDLENQDIQTNGNRLLNNTAFNCKTGGFVASLGSHDNYIGHNTAHCNLEDCLGIPDLQDRNPTCGANTWFKNVADSASPECILQ